MSNRKKLRSAEDIIRGGKLPEKSVPICMRADLVAEFEAAERELEAANRSRRKTLDAGSVAREISQRIQALEAQMAEDTVEFRMRGLPRPKYRELRAEHPPRKADDGSVNERDLLLGVNEQTFFTALIRACTYDPELSDEVWGLLLDEKLTDRQFETLVNTAWGLNERDVDVPFSHAASAILRSSEPE